MLKLICVPSLTINLKFQLKIGIFSVFEDNRTYFLEFQLQPIISIFNSKSLFNPQIFI